MKHIKPALLLAAVLWWILLGWFILYDTPRETTTTNFTQEDIAK